MDSFVFVVCGAKPFISELNFSLRFLRYFSRHRIVVLTDSRRNEIPIEHNDIIDVETPGHFGHHQAHLWLETRLPEFMNLQAGDRCCYLDSDVVAINDTINQVFEHYHAPITAAYDHCSFDYFSVGVVNCQCRSEFREIEEQFAMMLNYFPEIKLNEEHIQQQRLMLKSVFRKMKFNLFADKCKGLKYIQQRYLKKQNDIVLNGQIRFSFADYCWRNMQGDILDFDYPYYYGKLKKEHGIYIRNAKWYHRSGRELAPDTPHCSHLRHYLRKNYGINIPGNWRHRNGGVFLFGHESKNFFAQWHTYTMSEIEKGYIKPYDDQATLAVCMWQHSIENSNLLPDEFNFIADHGNKNIAYCSTRGYTRNAFATISTPALLHVYNEWGNPSWDIWQSVIETGQQHGILPPNNQTADTL